ncbi:MAG TPA: helix-turn-helix domain-containing protein [Isosphaeraceae bacterium]|jgi:putative transcriptional regulator|nr:helix-turn-helix domain-containing protein [Isosphaeraceae bacterium]
MSKRTKHRSRTVAHAKGQHVIEGLRELADALKAGEPLEARFTVRTYKITPPPEYNGDAVRRVRDLMGMSQAAFAAFLGVDPSTVRSWEQGLRPPSPLACRMLSEIEAAPSHWRKRLAECIVGPETRGPAARTHAKIRRRRPPRIAEQRR